MDDSAPVLVSDGMPITFLDVDYIRFRTRDGGDLYVTDYGLPFIGHLLPENWHEHEWFKKSREKLKGTSMVYRVKTKPVRGFSKALVVKWCRVGEEVPLDTFTLNKFIEAEFNTPYEEFSLLMEMRNRADKGSIRTHKPLAIYVPAKRFELWQTGRSKSKIAQKKAKFRDVELDIYRQYIMIYEWIKGDAVTDLPGEGITESEKKAFIAGMMERAVSDMWMAGFRVLDFKPQHVIVRRKKDGSLLNDKTGKPAYGIVDFELLARTPSYEAEVKQERRHVYLKRQRDRFDVHVDPTTFPRHLHPMNIRGVDYVYGDTESTHGKLWVVGHDPDLFDYFQPERWRRTHRESLSETAQVYYTKTKDEIQLVWKVSRVGEVPDISEVGPRMATYGFNSPFEEFAMALELSAAGVPTTYPRAIYMLGHQSTIPPDQLDQSRYDSHKDLLTVEGDPILRRDRNYITLWGFWNGPDEALATDGEQERYWRGMNAVQAMEAGLIDDTTYMALCYKMMNLLDRAEFESVNLKGTHFLVTQNPDGEWIRDADGLLAVRLCNFEFLRRVERAR